jgi:di/tricarboxylate transporter
MDLRAFFTEYKEHILVVLAGLFGIAAAVIKSKMRPSAALSWFFASVFCLLLGFGLLFLEYALYPFDPDVELTPSNTGAMLVLGGCLCIAAGGLWGFINFIRLFTAAPVAESSGKKKKSSEGG